MKKLEIKYIHKDKLCLLKGNPRKEINPDVKKKLAYLIKEHGFQNPLQVFKEKNDKYSILCGNHRFVAACELGITEYPCLEYKGNKRKALARAISDNRSSDWTEFDYPALKEIISEIDVGDFDIELTGFDDDELKGMFDFEGELDGSEDEVPEVDKKDVKTKLGDLYQLGEHRLLCGDATVVTDVEKLMNGEKADFGFCDPPYNLGFKYNSYDDNKSENDYIEFSKLWFSNMKQFTKRQAITLGTKNIVLMAILGDVAGVGCWIKKNWTTSCHIAKLQQWEPIFFYGDYIKHKRTSDLYEINRIFQKDVGNDHPCPKQIALIEDILKNYSDIHVLDLFLGSGSTLIACEKTSRKCYGMELDPYYCDVIIKRWEDYTGKEAVLLN